MKQRPPCLCVCAVGTAWHARVRVAGIGRKGAGLRGEGWLRAAVRGVPQRGCVETCGSCGLAFVAFIERFGRTGVCWSSWERIWNK